MGDIDDLAALVPPPAGPHDADGDWGAVESGLGTALPADFKALVARYGVGGFCNEIFWYRPFSEANAMVDVVRKRLAVDAEGLRDAPEEFPYPLFPSPGGVLPWADTTDRVRLYWRTGGEPGRWPVVVAEWGVDVVVHELRAAQFLQRWAAGTLGCPIMGNWSGGPGDAPFFSQSRVLDGWFVRLAPTTRPVRERVETVDQLFAPWRNRRRRFVTSDSAEVHLLSTTTGWEVEYRTVARDTDSSGAAIFGQTIIIEFAPGERDAARLAILEVSATIGSPVTYVATQTRGGDWISMNDFGAAWI